MYGDHPALPKVEADIGKPLSPYAATKVFNEVYADVFARCYGLETIGLRYFNVFGPRQRPDSQYAAVIPLFIDALLAGTSPQVHGDGHQSRDFTFIADTVQANLCAAAAPAKRCAGRAFNIARGKPASLFELLAILAAEVGVPATPEHVDPRVGDVRHSQADNSRLLDLLPEVEPVRFVDGLTATVEWMRSEIERAET